MNNIMSLFNNIWFFKKKEVKIHVTHVKPNANEETNRFISRPASEDNEVDVKYARSDQLLKPLFNVIRYLINHDF